MLFQSSSFKQWLYRIYLLTVESLNTSFNQRIHYQSLFLSTVGYKRNIPENCKKYISSYKIPSLRCCKAICNHSSPFDKLNLSKYLTSTIVTAPAGYIRTNNSVQRNNARGRLDAPCLARSSTAKFLDVYVDVGKGIPLDNKFREEILVKREPSSLETRLDARRCSGSGANRTVAFRFERAGQRACNTLERFLIAYSASRPKRATTRRHGTKIGEEVARRRPATRKGAGGRKIHRISPEDRSSQFAEWLSSQFSIRRISFSFFLFFFCSGETGSANEIDSFKTERRERERGGGDRNDPFHLSIKLKLKLFTYILISKSSSI